MKKLTLFFFIILGLSFTLRGQTSGDIAKVLQKCLNLPELESNYPQNPDGSYKQLTIMQHGVSFPEDIQVSKSGVAVLFKSKQEVMKGNITYFLFNDFTLTSSTARIAFAYYYNPANPEAVLLVNLNMEKRGNEWLIIQSQFERR
jgi:hypothetical protein